MALTDNHGNTRKTRTGAACVGARLAMSESGEFEPRSRGRPPALAENTDGRGDW
jgi:hypothetical protein